MRRQSLAALLLPSLLVSSFWLAAGLAPASAQTAGAPQAASEATGEYLRGEEFSIAKGLQVYNLSAEAEHRQPARLAPDNVKAVEDYFKGSHAFVLVDQMIADGAYRIGGAVSTLNGDDKTKDPVIALMISQELIPDLFRRYQMFKALYGVALADVFSPQDMRGYMAKLTRNEPLDEALKQKIREATRRFSLANNKLSEMIFLQMTRQQKSRFDTYGLNLDFNAAAKAKAGSK